MQGELNCILNDVTTISSVFGNDMHNSMRIMLSYLKVSVLLWSLALCLWLHHTCDDIQYNSNNLERDIAFREQ